MTSLRGLGPPGDRGASPADSHGYAMWDAAYVLGSLSASDRREFEAHIAQCPSCREAVTELSGMPALLSQLDRDEVAAISEADQTPGPQISPELLPTLLTAVRSRRRRTRFVTWAAGAAAAAVLAIGVFVGVANHSPAPAPPSTATASAVPMAQIGTSALSSTVSVSSQRWGTFIDLKCVCLAPIYASHDKLAMVVIGRDGTSTQLATWVAEPGHTATPAGSISTPVDQIAAVQVVSADGGRVLLERSL